MKIARIAKIAGIAKIENRCCLKDSGNFFQFLRSF